MLKRIALAACSVLLGRDVILVAIATGIVYEILENVLD